MFNILNINWNHSISRGPKKSFVPTAILNLYIFLHVPKLCKKSISKVTKKNDQTGISLVLASMSSLVSIMHK